MGMGTFFPKRKHSTYTQLQSWEITVARAAPTTPISSTNMNTGSSTMFTTAPSMTEIMPFLAKPWQMMNWFMPKDSRLKTVPARYTVKYCSA